MDSDSFRRLAGKYGVPLGTMEKDYAVTILLKAISGFPELSRMAFKGGTAIKKIYFQEARFSEDLDFTCAEDVSKGLEASVRKAVEGGLDVQFTGVESIATKGDSRKFSVNYDDLNDHPNSIKIDLSLREKIVRDTGQRQVLHIYDLGSFLIPAMSLEEIMAEKVRAVIYSPRPRHLYDLWYLSEKGVLLDLKLTRLKIKDVYKEDLDIAKLKEGIAGMEKRWKTDLESLLPSVPSFQTVSKYVTTKIEKAAKS